MLYSRFWVIQHSFKIYIPSFSLGWSRQGILWAFHACDIYTWDSAFFKHEEMFPNFPYIFVHFCTFLKKKKTAPLPSCPKICHARVNYVWTVQNNGKYFNQGKSNIIRFRQIKIIMFILPTEKNLYASFSSNIFFIFENKIIF